VAAAFDRSANAVLQQVSLPILDETGAVIGAVTYGLDLNRVGLATSSFETPAPENPRLRSLESSICSASGVSPETVTFVCDALLPHCCNPTFVKAVRKQNALEIPLGRIKELDQQWINAEELLPVQQKILQNECAGALRSIVVRHARIREAFVMDNQGALVGANQLTSDYWQGDEAKWQGSFGDGQGGVDVGAAKFDRSANAVLQQISLPILDADGNVLGAVTYGIEVDR
jgi:hypothetical protein